MRGTGAEWLLYAGSGTALPGLLEQCEKLCGSLICLLEDLHPSLLQNRFLGKGGVGRRDVGVLNVRQRRSQVGSRRLQILPYCGQLLLRRTEAAAIAGHRRQGVGDRGERRLRVGLTGEAGAIDRQRRRVGFVDGDALTDRLAELVAHW